MSLVLRDDTEPEGPDAEQHGQWVTQPPRSHRTLQGATTPKRELSGVPSFTDMRGTDERLTEASCEIERRMGNCLDSCLQGCLSPHALG